jgi:hypothetical protein
MTGAGAPLPAVLSPNNQPAFDSVAIFPWLIKGLGGAQGNTRDLHGCDATRNTAHCAVPGN